LKPTLRHRFAAERGLCKTTMKEVNMLELSHFADETPIPYETVTDLFRTLNEEINRLYLLSLLLTADHDKAERCLISAIGECVEGIGFFMDEARPWTRLALFKHAIETIRPVPERADNVSFTTIKRSSTVAENNPLAAILSLDAFERFVFVMSILEGQSDQECANLLRCSRRDVVMARVLALKRQSNADTQADEVFQS
jgi:hypothetical protein